jgi:glycolate oxidase iron-sulfur subunit
MQIKPFSALTDPQQRQEAETIVKACVHCGFCNATCPTYQLLGDELDGPRGRIYLIKQVLEGNAASAKTQQHLDRCLTCRSCETTCPSGVNYGHLVDIGRAIVEQHVKRSWLDFLKRRLLTLWLPHPQRFARLTAWAQLVAPVLPNSLRRQLPVKRRPEPFKPKAQHVRKVLLLDGCIQPALAPEINDAAEHILDRFGIGVIKAKAAGCCGAVSYHLNFQEEGLNFMRAVIDTWLPFLDQGIEAIVTTASGCGITVKEYGRLLAHDEIYRHSAERISKSCVDIVELLEKEDWTGITFKPVRKIAWQAPCTLQHGQKLNGRVEAFLQKRGFELTEVPNAHLCCGSAGTYSLLQPKLAKQLGHDKLTALTSGQPDEIATANIGCLLHLRAKTLVPVRHWLEMVNEALAGN